MDPSAAVDTINARFGRHPRSRALHAKGFYAQGTFTGSAPELTRAAHLQGTPVPALVRFSNGSGNPDDPDFLPDVRGLGVKLDLPDGSRTDLVMQSAPYFFSHTPDEFLAFVAAGPKYLLRHPAGLRNAPALRPIPSFAECRFYGVHAYRWIAADGSRRHVRCEWIPEAGDHRIGPRKAKALGPDYLREEFPGRLPVRFALEVVIAEPGDPIDDPAQHWPSSRRRVRVGTLEITAVIDDPETPERIVVFDPSRVTDGIELTADPVLAFRPQAYSASVERRTT